MRCRLPVCGWSVWVVLFFASTMQGQEPGNSSPPRRSADDPSAIERTGRPGLVEGVSIAVQQFLACTGKTDVDEVAGLLERCTSPAMVSPIDLATLGEQLNLASPLYAERDRYESLRIRAYLLVRLARYEVPAQAAGVIAEILENSMDPLSRAAAARAAKKLRQHPAHLRRILRSTAENMHAISSVTLERFSQVAYPAHESTDERREAAAALAEVELEKPMTNPQPSRQITLDQLRENMNRMSSTETPALREISSSPLGRGERTDKRPLESGFRFVDSTGEFKDSRAFLGKPVLIAFLYTQCTNAGRCSRLVELFATMQRRFQSPTVQFLLVTLEPRNDSPAELDRMARQHGLILNSTTQMLQPDEQTLERLLRNFKVPVSRNCGLVTEHDTAVYVLDEIGRLVDSYDFASLDQSAVGQRARLRERQP